MFLKFKFYELVFYNFYIIKVVYLVESVEQFQQQFNDQKQRIQPHQQCGSCMQVQPASSNNHQRRFSSNSAITVITNPLRSNANNFSNMSLSPTTASGSLLSLLQLPTFNHQPKNTYIQLYELMKHCLMSADRIALTKLLNAYSDFHTLKLPKQNSTSIDERVELLIQKLLNGSAFYSSPPSSATISSMMNSYGSVFPVPTLLPTIFPSPELASKVPQDEFESSVLENTSVSM